MKRLAGSAVLFFLIAVVLPMALAGSVRGLAATEAPVGFDNQTNGFVNQATFKKDKATFEEREEIADGLGPLYNAQACAECHQNPVSGGISQITELRAGHLDASGNFVEAPGGSLINDRAIDPAIQERVPDTETIRTFRTSLNVLGDGFVECIDDAALTSLAAAQIAQTNGKIAGQVIYVPVLEASPPYNVRVGRFGWKNQHASLVSFAADAYLNEMGITSPLQPTENTSLGNPVTAFDSVPDPEDNGSDVEAFARFMRATKAPPPDAQLAATPAAQAGSLLFDQIGCSLCHVRTLVTAPTGTPINGGTFVVPAALGDKIIHPFSDFLLHDVGTGDGIVQNGPPETANKLRTPPLWGVRTRTRLIHDGASLTFKDAIFRHRGEATSVINAFRALSYTQKQQLYSFLKSL